MASLDLNREGRRSVRPQAVKTVQLTVRVTGEEAERIYGTAHALGVTVAAYMRSRLLAPRMPSL